MSLDVSNYVVLGYKLPFGFSDLEGNKIDIWDDKYLPYIEQWQDEKFILVVDGMCGKYCVFGYNFTSDMDDDEFIEINLTDIYLYDNTGIKEKFKEVFGFLPIEEPKIYAFNHYS